MNPFLTARGKWMLGLGLLYCMVGVLAREPLVVLLGQIPIVLLAVSALLCLPGAMALDRRLVRLRLSPPEGAATRQTRSSHVAGHALELDLEIVNLAPVAMHGFRTLPFVSAGLNVEPAEPIGRLGQVSRTQARFRLSCPQAGRQSVQGFDVVICDPIGLVQNIDYLPCVHVFEAYPAVGRMRRLRTRRRDVAHVLERVGQTVRQPVNSGTDIRELRDYAPGDPLRSVAWKATARARKLVARDYEQEVSKSTYALVDISSTMRGGQRSGQKLEHVIALVSELAENYVRERQHIGLMTFDERLYAHLPTGNSTAHLRRILNHLIGLQTVASADLTEFDDAELEQFLVDYLLVQERLDFRKGGQLDPTTGINQALLERWLQSVLPAEEARLASPVLNEALVNPTLSPARRFLQLRGVHIPYRAEARLGMKERGLAEAIEQLARSGRERHQILVVSDLCGIMNLELLTRAIKLAHLKGHRLKFVVPFTPAYYDEHEQAGARYQVVRELFTTAETEERMRVVRRLQSLGANVKLLKPGQLVLDHGA
ncbi:MAG: DUF58 domain-containing protein [Bradymonadaceae bacterium]|nr:DUF58 domain-containing protein [Lujinxingiaceae bacterium]